MSNKTIACPVSGEKINENVARIAAFLTIIVSAVAVWFKSPVILILLGLDFAVRAFTPGRYSPVKYISKQLFSMTLLDEKIGDAAPKKFAAGIGFIFSITIAALQLAKYYVTADAVAALLIFCASLEAFLSYCLGCRVYMHFILPLYNSNKQNK